MELGGKSVLERHEFTLRGTLQLLAGVLLLALPAVSWGEQADPNALASAASQAMAERRFSEAAEIYSDLARKFPNEPTLQANLGMALHFSSRDSEAVQPLQQAVRAMPSSFPAQFALGASLSRLGRHAEAVGPLRESTKINPRHVFAHVLLGEALEEVGEPARALESWRSLERLDASNPFAHAGLVRCHEELAAEAFDRLRKRAPESPYMLRLLGHTRLAARQYPSALYLFRSALERQPGVRAIHEAVASVYEGAGRSEWADTERQKAELLPELNCTEVQSPECSFAAGRFEQAPAIAPESAPSDLFWAARFHARLAEQSFAKLVALPDAVEKLTLLADVLASQGQYSRAADACRQALGLNRGSGALERQLAELLYLARRIDEARPLLERFIRLEPGDPRWAAMLGSLLAEEQEYDKAVPLLQASLTRPGAPASVRLDLGRSYLALDQPDKAVPHLQSSLSLDTDGSIHYQLAQALRRLGMREEAQHALARYRELDARNRQQIEAGASLEMTAPD